MKDVVIASIVPCERIAWLRVMVASTTCVWYMTSWNLSAVALFSSSPRSLVFSCVSSLQARQSADHVTLSPFSASIIVLSVTESTQLSVCMICDLMLRPISVLTKPSPFHVAMPLYFSISSVDALCPPGLSAAARYFGSIAIAARTYAVGCCIATRMFAPTAAALYRDTMRFASLSLWLVPPSRTPFRSLMNFVMYALAAFPYAVSSESCTVLVNTLPLAVLVDSL